MEQGALLESAPTADVTVAAGKMMPLVDHLGELRRRIIVSLLALVAGTVFGWFQVGAVLHFLAGQVGHFVFFHPMEAFLCCLDVALAIGFVVASPVILGEAWLFIVPGLMPGEVRFCRRWLPLVMALFVCGMAFGYFVAYPIALRFFFRMGANMTAMLSIQRYLGFLWTWIFPFGLMFEVPVILVVLAKLGIVTSAALRRRRKYFLFGTFVLAIFICPSEIVLQFLIVIPLAILYELSIPLVARVKPVSLYGAVGEVGRTTGDG